MKVKEVLFNAADHIERVGWYQGAFTSEGSYGIAKGLPCCVWGAIEAVERDLNTIYKALDVLRRHTGSDSVASWNDNPERTKEEVLTTLRAAAAVIDY